MRLFPKKKDIEKIIGLQWYDFDQCGFYYARQTPDHHDNGNPIFGGIPIIGSEIEVWCRKHTSLSKRKVCPAGKHHDGLYIFRMVEMGTGDFILIVIESHKDGKKGVMYLPGDTDTSQSKIKPEYSKAKPGYIAGTPFYYWIVPSKNCYAAIKIDSRINKSALEESLQSFMAMRSSFSKVVERTEVDGNVVEKRAFKDPKWKADKKSPKKKQPAYRPKVRGKMSRVHGELAKIVRNRSNIKEYIIKADFDLTRGIDKKLIRIFSKLTNHAISTEHPKLSVSAHFEVTPTKDDIEALFEVHSSADSVENNIGFVYKDGTREWIDNSRNFEQLSCELEYESVGSGSIPGIVDIGSLAGVIDLNREELLKSLDG